MWVYYIQNDRLGHTVPVWVRGSSLGGRDIIQNVLELAYPNQTVKFQHILDDISVPWTPINLPFALLGSCDLADHFECNNPTFCDNFFLALRGPLIFFIGNVHCGFATLALGFNENIINYTPKPPLVKIIRATTTFENIEPPYPPRTNRVKLHYFPRAEYCIQKF